MSEFLFRRFISVFRRSAARLGIRGVIGAALIAGLHAAEPRRPEPTRRLERSYWVHASLGLTTQRGYFGSDFPATPAPIEEEVRNAVRLLVGPYGANRLYLIYHREMPLEDARRLFLVWRRICPDEVEIVPALVTRMYDKAQTPVFSANELKSLADYFHEWVNPTHIAIYDIAARRDNGEAAKILTDKFPDGLLRLGLQPDEPLKMPFMRAVEDTWSAFCHGKSNEQDWSRPGFGAETLRQWVTARNPGPRPIAWDLITVAWDYTATERGAYPGYDDAEKNMPLPLGRNRAAVKLIRETAEPRFLAGFSSDLRILQENSRTAVHDGSGNSFYECLKLGEPYRGYYHEPFEEIAAIYREMREKGE